jgi:hypothetical protein
MLCAGLSSRPGGARGGLIDCNPRLDMRGHFDAFFRITARWHLTQVERRALLGSPTNERWFHFIRATVPSVTPEEFVRVDAVIRIDRALSECVRNPHEITRWFRTPEMAPPFLGHTPLALLFRGTNGFEPVADYLEARRPIASERGLR